MRRVVIPYFVLSLIVIAVCLILALLKIIEWSIFFQISGIVGGLASVIGLLGLSTKTIKSSDLESINSELLEKVANTKKEIEETNSQISTLEIRKDQLEILVEKASRSLFYEKEIKLLYEKLSRQLENEKEIKATLEDIEQTEKEAEILNTEINIEPNLKETISILKKAAKYDNSNLIFTYKLPFWGSFDFYLGNIWPKHRNGR